MCEQECVRERDSGAPHPEGSVRPCPERERERDSVCVREIESMKERACVREKSVCERDSVCERVCERKRESGAPRPEGSVQP